MAKIGTFSKQPSEVLDYDVDYTDWLPESDEVDAASVVITQTRGTTATLSLTAKETGVKVLKLWLSGGAHGDQYLVTVTTTTTDGRVKEDEIVMNIKEI